MGKVILDTHLHIHKGKKPDLGPTSGTTQSHNNLTMKYGQWLYYYKITTDYTKNEETAELMRVNLNIHNPEHN
jgi:hypothetical protein